jgi:hypothetical protein
LHGFRQDPGFAGGLSRGPLQTFANLDASLLTGRYDGFILEPNG